ncbi:MAG: HD domain-containing protein [Dehalococcoidia bacterium]
MAPRDQWHAVETLRLLGLLSTDADLAVAALLHDAGKGYIRLHERVLYVLAAHHPALLHRLARSQGAGWRAALDRMMRHAETGAAMTLAAGSSQRAAELILQHHEPNRSDLAALALLDADERA